MAVAASCELHAAGSARRSDWPSALRNIVPLRDRLPPADANQSHSRRQALAVVLRGDVRDTYQESSRALKLHLLHPAEQIGLAPHVFLVGYQEDSLALSRLSAFFAAWLRRVVELPRNGSTQVSTLATSLRLVAAHYSSESHAGEDAKSKTPPSALVILRFDIVLKANLVPLLDRARLIGPSATSGFRFLFREMPSDIRAFPRLLAMLTATSTRNSSSSSSWWLSSPEPPLRRVSDVLHALSFDVLHCLLAALWQQRAGRHPANNLANLHNIAGLVEGVLRQAAPSVHVGLLLPKGGFDSNPCRGTCRPNPVFSLLRTERTIVRSQICQRAADFELDPQSNTLCCPSPESCCPLSVSSCQRPAASLFNGSVWEWRAEGAERLASPVAWIVEAALARRDQRLCAAHEWRPSSSNTSDGCKYALGARTLMEGRDLCSEVLAAAASRVYPRWMIQSTLVRWAAFCNRSKFV